MNEYYMVSVTGQDAQQPQPPIIAASQDEAVAQAIEALPSGTPFSVLKFAFEEVGAFVVIKLAAVQEDESEAQPE